MNFVDEILGHVGKKMKNIQAKEGSRLPLAHKAPFDMKTPILQEILLPSVGILL